MVQGQGGTVDITELILDDHHEQRRLFAILEQVGRCSAPLVAYARKPGRSRRSTARV